MIRRLAPPFALAVVLAAAACGTKPPAEDVATTQAALATESVFSIADSTLSCEVSNRTFGGSNPFLCVDDMAGADLGIPVYDGTNTWVLFGDALTTDQGQSTRWSWGPSSDPVGYFAGATSSTVCGGLELVTIANDDQQGACAPYMGDVFAPDVVVAPATADFVFQGSAVQAPTVGSATLPANSAIPGTDEVPSGAFYYGGSLYTFYTGAPEHSSYFLDDPPVASVSYLTQWAPVQSVSSPFTAAGSRQVVSMVDYSTSVVDGSPTTPRGWSPQPPLGGNFIQVSPVASGGYLYLFGTGAYRYSQIFLARLLLSTFESTLPSSLVQATSFQVWNGTEFVSGGAGAMPIVADEDAGASAPDVGELSVQSYAQGVWLMMYAPRGASKVVVRWATGATGPWSAETVVLDTSTAAAAGPYCCTGTPPQGSDLPQCSGQQFVECTAAGLPQSAPYAPYLFPTLVPLSAYGYQVSYMISSFVPYGTSLMTFEIGITPCPPQPCGTDQSWSTTTCACACRCGEIHVDGHILCESCEFTPGGGAISAP
jgi:Domain of unknown function (DUF4185)